MVHRHIHGTVVTIFTQNVTDTGHGYVGRTYATCRRSTSPAYRRAGFPRPLVPG